MKKLKIQWTTTKVIFYLIIFAYLMLCWFLFYNQLFYYQTGKFESDTALHVKFAVEDGYYHSLAAFIYKFLYMLPASELLVSFVLAVATAISIYLSYYLIKELLFYSKEGNDFSVRFQKDSPTDVAKSLIYTMAIFANLVMGFYLREANVTHYIGYENANMWHNSTYILMRPFAILTVDLLMEVYYEFKALDKLKFSSWCKLTVLLALATGFKASFLTVIAPAFCIMLLVDLIKGASFKKTVCFASFIIPSLIIMYIQSRAMSFTGSSNGISIAFFKALSLRGDHPKATLILSILFPLVVFLYHIKDFYKDKIYLASLFVWLIAFIEVMLFAETGERALDGNFMWGYSIALFFLFITSMVKLIRDWYSGDSITNKVKFIVLAVETIILFWHVMSGAWYFTLLLTGVTYFV